MRLSALPIASAKTFAVAALIALSPVTGTSAQAGGHSKSPLLTKPSAHDAATTLDRLEAVLTKKGIRVFARIDHTANAKGAGLTLAPTQVLMFGNPKLGTPLMQSTREIAIDLPMKALAWTDAEGKTFLSYTDPAALKARYGITDRDAVIAKMTKALDGLTTAATKP
ncbi:MAG: DUF302 domain-containing protein [Pseudomonadota bacterium]